MKHVRAGAVVLTLVFQPALLACPVCFQVEQSATTDGLRAAVLVLVAVTCCVLAGFGVFIARFVRSEALAGSERGTRLPSRVRPSGAAAEDSRSRPVSV